MSRSCKSEQYYWADWLWCCRCQIPPKIDWSQTLAHLPHSSAGSLLEWKMRRFLQCLCLAFEGRSLGSPWMDHWPRTIQCYLRSSKWDRWVLKWFGCFIGCWGGCYFWGGCRWAFIAIWIWRCFSWTQSYRNSLPILWSSAWIPFSRSARWGTEWCSEVSMIRVTLLIWP